MSRWGDESDDPPRTPSTPEPDDDAVEAAEAAAAAATDGPTSTSATGGPTSSSATGGPTSSSATGRSTAGELGKPVGRRIVLSMLGLGAVGVVFGKQLQDVQTTLMKPLTNISGAFADLVPDPNSFRFYNVTDSEPTRTAADYTLTVDGMVNKPQTFTLADLQALPQTALIKDFQCVTGWRVPQVHWSGVALPDLLDLVGVQSGAQALTFTSFDGVYTESLTVAQAKRRDIIVALQMLGAPVTKDHGGPVRLYVAPMYGYKSCKWLGGISLVPKVVPGYWEDEGYDVDAWVGKSNGRDDDAPTS